MTSQDWTILVVAIAGVLGSAGAWLRAQAAHARLNNLPQQPPKQP